MEWIESLVLGLVQGLTEFLPVSSDGHLTITQMAFAKLTGHGRPAAENLFFDVMLHLGTLTAILVHYRAVARTGLCGLLGANDVAPAYRRGAVIHVGTLMVVATLPLFPYAYFKRYLLSTFESPTAVGFGFLATATVLLLTMKLRGGEKGPDQMTWLDALLIGIAQTFAPLPGVSRSGLTVAMALGLGMSRAWSVGFSLLIAFPAILGATVMELKDFDRATLTTDRVAQTIAATIIAGLIGYLAIIWLVKIVRAGRLWYFSVYLFVLAIAVLATNALSKGTPDAPSATATERASGLSPAGSGVGRGEARPGQPLDRRFAPGARPDPVEPGLTVPVASRDANLVLGRTLAGHPR
ncbi:undecaprenyl-diphosphatase [Singulisphaera sp. GP187]|uniref:undecaprenyl-diphosphate phosphatase n=1 Tax=Singulisphaera sp. GP187 TaxID=1882752 RepID=UPI0009270D33|nr:undecaprenyl-diphosphate phosphatase [Singulisphaera sp. GP187]SIN98044.1 undecaprenyl-diphosphatase [Singulisphaera sp. GP187]